MQVGVCENLDRDTIVSFLRRRADGQANKVIYSFLNDDPVLQEQLTYKALHDRAEWLAQNLIVHHRKGERALMLYDSGPEFIIAFFACLMAGIVAVPAYPPRKNRKLDRLQKIAMDSGATIILTTSRILDVSGLQVSGSHGLKDVEIICTDTVESVEHPSCFPEIEPKDIAFLQYSSGTTGSPKGVIISHSNIIQNQRRIAASFLTTPDTVSVSWLPLFHDMGLGASVLQPVFIGCTVYLMSPTYFLQKPVRWLKAISDFSADVSGGPDFAYQLCADKICEQEMQGMDLSSWQVAFNGSEPIQANTIRRFNEKFGKCGFSSSAHLPCYGMAEATLFISGMERGDGINSLDVEKESFEKNHVVAPQSGQAYQSLVSSGHLWLSDEIKVIDPSNFQVLPEDQVGELWFRSSSVGQGYWGKKKLSKDTFGAALEAKSNKVWLRTGDLGFIHDKQIFVTGRLKDLIIIRGRNYYPQDIESVVSASTPAFPAAGAAAFSVPAKGTEGIVVVQEVKRTQIRKIDPEKVIRAISEEVASNLDLSVHDVVLVKPATLSRASSGKIQRSLNRARYLSGDFDPIASLLSLKKKSTVRQADKANSFLGINQIEEWIVSELSKELDKPNKQIDLDANFLSLGLDSVSSVSLMAKLSQWIGRDLPPTLAYDYVTVRQLSKFITGSSNPDPVRTGPKQLDNNIAVVGMACRFPGADNLEEFWQNLCDGRCEIGAYPQSRAYGVDVDSGHYRGAFLGDIEHFDNEYFSISSKEARFVDPQHRLALELSDEAMRHAGYQPAELAGSDVGVFIGVGQNDYMLMGMASDEVDSAYFGTGCSLSMAANRISYFYDFRGPSMAIDTACSASLVALHQAVTSLRVGECDIALAGGVKLIMFSQTNKILGKAQMLSPDGQCRTFDNAANGYVRGEGAGMLLLKPLSAAEASGDRILAVIKGSATNQDGRSNGITAPNGIAQQSVIKKALKDAGVSAQDVAFVEAHGTATSLGDPIEVNALSDIYGVNRDFGSPLLVGSVKANIGHLEQAAGVAGAIKTVLCLSNNMLPGQINFNVPNKYIDWENIRISVPKTLTPLVKEPDAPPFAGVSSFGFGGSNAHMLIQQYKSIKSNMQPITAPTPKKILALTGKQSASLTALQKRYGKHLRSLQGFSLGDVCSRLNAEQPYERYRSYVVGDTLDEISQSLSSGALKVAETQSPYVCFMFTGQGSQYLDMAKAFYDQSKVFRDAMNLCSSLFDGYLDKSILSIIYGADADCSLIHQTVYTQPSLFCVGYSLAEMWKSAGVFPDVVLGHSIGEFAAACIAGVLSLEDAVKLVAFRGRLIHEAPGTGSMLAVRAELESIAPALSEHSKTVDVAAINGDKLIVLSGQRKQINQIARKLDEGGVAATKLNVSHGFHSPLMDPVLSEYRKIVESVDLSAPKIKFVSCLTGKAETTLFSTTQYWVDHIRKAVLFRDGVNCAYRSGANCFVELGPGPILSKLANRIIKDESVLVGCSIGKNGDAWGAFLETLGELFCYGIDVTWSSFMPRESQKRIPLPAKVYRKKRLWLDLAENMASAIRQDAHFTGSESISSLIYQVDWKCTAPLVLKRDGKELITWLLIMGRNEPLEQSLAQSFSEIIVSLGHRCIIVERAEKTESVCRDHFSVDCESVHGYSDLLSQLFEEKKTPNVIVDFAAASGFSKASEELTPASAHAGDSPGFLLRSISETYKRLFSDSMPRVCFLTSKFRDFNEADASSAFRSLSPWDLRYLASTAYPDIEIQCIDYDIPANSHELLRSLVADLLCEEKETSVIYSESERRVARLRKISRDEGFLRKPHFRSDSRYLLSGDEDELIWAAGRWMAERGAIAIDLLTKQKSDAFDDIQLRFSKLGVDARVLEISLVADQPISEQLEMYGESTKPIAGIIHISGATTPAFPPSDYLGMDPALTEEINQIWQLHCATKDISLEHFILISTRAGFSTNKIMQDEAAKNEFIESFALWRRSAGLNCLSLQFDVDNQTLGQEVVADETNSETIARVTEQEEASLEKAAGSAPISILTSRWLPSAKQVLSSSKPFGPDGVTLLAADTQAFPTILQRAMPDGSNLHRISAVINGDIAVKGSLWIMNADHIAVFKLVKKLVDSNAIQDIVAIRVFTVNAFSVHDETVDLDAAHGVWGLLQSLSREYAHLSVCQIDLTRNEMERAEGSLKSHYISELIDFAPTDSRMLVAYRSGQFYRQRLFSTENRRSSKPAEDIRHQGVYVVIGGASGVGLAFVKYLRLNFDARVAIIGRRTQDQLEHLPIELSGFGRDVIYLQCAVEDTPALSDQIERVRRTFGEVHGLIHSAMVHDVQSLKEMSQESFDSVLAPKCAGIRSLAAATEHLALDFLMVFSSIQSFIGYSLSASYSAASTYLDGYTKALAAIRNYRVCLVNWSYWGDVGAGANESLRKLMEQHGQSGLTSEEAFPALLENMRSSGEQLVIAKATEKLMTEMGWTSDYRLLQPEAPFSSQSLNINLPLYIDQIDEWRDGFISLQSGMAALMASARQVVSGILLDLNLHDRQSLKKNIDQGNVLKGYERLLESLIEDLSELLDTGISLEFGLFDEHATELQRQYPELRSFLPLLCACLKDYKAIITGKKFALDTIFPNESNKLVYSVYESSIVSRYYNQVLAKAVLDLARQHSKLADRPLRILEIGAGTGASCKAIFSELEENNIVFEYCYTDLWEKFLQEARKCYRDTSIEMEFRLLDIGADPVNQGFSLQSYDLVVATNVIHATPVIAESLRNIKRLLSANGTVLINESVEVQEFSKLSFSLIPSWWNVNETSHRLKGSPLADLRSWRALLKDAGYRDIYNCVPDEEVFSSQAVLRACTDNVIWQRSVHGEKTFTRRADTQKRTGDSHSRQREKNLSRLACIESLDWLMDSGYSNVTIISSTSERSESVPALSSESTLVNGVPGVERDGTSRNQSLSVSVSELGRKILSDSSSVRVKLMTEYLQKLTALVSENSIDSVPDDMPIVSLGLDSLLVVELKNKIESDFKLSLSIVEIFKSGSLRELASNLVVKLDEEAIAESDVTDNENERKKFEEGVL